MSGLRRKLSSRDLRQPAFSCVCDPEVLHALVPSPSFMLLALAALYCSR